MGLFTNLYRQSVGGVFRERTPKQQESTMPRLSHLHETIHKNDKEEMAGLLKAHPLFVNAVFQHETAFTRAADNRYLEAAEAILESGYFEPDAVNQFDMTPLYVCAKHGLTNFMLRLLNMGADPNISDLKGKTPLNSCTWYDRHEAAEILLSHGVDPDKEDTDGITPLIRACHCVSINTVRVLIEHGCDVNKAANDLKTPLMAALPSSHSVQVERKNISDMLDICEMLVAAGCDINAQDDNGKTALHLCVDAQDFFGVCFLAENGCDLSLTDKEGYTAFQSAIQPCKCRYEIARYLLYFGADARSLMSNHLNDELNFPIAIVLRTMPARGEKVLAWTRALLLIALRAAVSPTPVTLPTVEEMRSLNGSPPLPEDLPFDAQVEKDVSRWTNSNRPCSLQHQARLKIREILGNRTNIIPKINSLPIGRDLKRFVGLGVQVDSFPFLKLCRLHMYIMDELYFSVQELLASGVDINIPMRNCTPLSLAIGKKNIPIVAALLRHHPRPRGTRVNAVGDSVLHVAAENGMLEFLDDLIHICGTVDPVNDHQATPLAYAVICGHFDVATHLAKRGADVTVKSTHGLPVIHVAAGSGAGELVGLCLEKGVDPDLEDPFGNTPLHLAASMGVEYLNRQISLPALYESKLMENLDAVQRVVRGDSNLTKPKPGSHADVVRRLLQRGADLSKTNADGESPMDLAFEHGSDDVIDVLHVKIE